MSSWNKGAGDLALVTGIGYAGPDSSYNNAQLMLDSHFSGSDLWDTAVTSTEAPLEIGWITRVLQQAAVAKYDGAQPLATAGIVGNIPAGPVMSNAKNICITPDIDLLNRGLNTTNLLGTNTYKALYGTQYEIDASSISIDEFDHVTVPPTFGSTTALGKQFYYLSQLISGFAKTNDGQAISGLGIPVYVMNVSSYDFHINQVARQTGMLADLATSLSAFRQEMIQNKLWDDILVSTYAEFGRTINQNSAQGTDHGQSSTHFVMGGNVKGGVYGTQRPLANSMRIGASTILPYTLDFRYLYATFIQDWLGLSSSVTNTVLGNDPVTNGYFSSLGPFQKLLRR